MRHAAWILAALAITACSSEPEFDEHYETLSQDIEERAAQIEKDMAQPRMADETADANLEKQE
jgi:hypothetical protein